MCVYVSIYTCMYVCMHVYMHVCMYDVCMYAHTCMHVSIYLRMYRTFTFWLRDPGLAVYMYRPSGFKGLNQIMIYIRIFHFLRYCSYNFHNYINYLTRH